MGEETVFGRQRKQITCFDVVDGLLNDKLPNASCPLAWLLIEQIKQDSSGLLVAVWRRGRHGAKLFSVVCGVYSLVYETTSNKMVQFICLLL